VRGQNSQPLRGTLVVAVPVKEGLVACADKRLFNTQAGSFTDSFVKIRKVNNSALFVATHTVGFFDAKTEKWEFDAFEIVTKRVVNHDLEPEAVLDRLKKETRPAPCVPQAKFAEWPESDERTTICFQPLFYSVKENRARVSP
jgi:hypothetical protein